MYLYGLPEGVESSKFPILATANWNGWFADSSLHLMYSASAGQIAKGKNIYYLMCGNIYEKGPVLAYLDVLYSRSALDTQQRITTLQNPAGGLIPVTAQNTEYFTVIANVDYRFHPKWNGETLRSMREEVQPVFSSAALYVSGQSSDRTKYSELYTFLTERFDYQAAYTVTPAYSLLCRGIGDSRAFSQVYAAMCQRIGLEAESISGTRNGQTHWWNLIRLDGKWYHLDLIASAEFLPMTDGEMNGYEWDRDTYPATK